jgi:DNA-binding transcriptional MerR regulator
LRSSLRFLGPAQAARRLGVSAKALRLYEARGLVMPVRNAAGWRSYGPDEMQRAADIVALRALGLGLAQVAAVLNGEAEDLAPAMAAHQRALEARMRQLSGTLEKVRAMRADLARGHRPTLDELKRIGDVDAAVGVEFELPWPWGGERFALHDIRPLNWIVGPLGSGKTRLALRLAEELPGARFIGLDRIGETAARLRSDPSLQQRIDRSLASLVDDGAAASEALVALLAGLEDGQATALVVDLLEQGLDAPTQQALALHLRRHRSVQRPLFLLTRSSTLLDPAQCDDDESILLCPANHSPPLRVVPCAGTPGYEAMASCLAAPSVRARTEGVIAWRPGVAVP